MLKELGEKGWSRTLTRLQNAGLLLEPRDEDVKKTWDTHPLIREFFGKRFKEENEESWKECHHVLFEYFQNLPEKEFPDTLEEMEPLYRAVHHGCIAGEYKEAKEKVFQNRIHRGQKFYSVIKLGTWTSDLAVLASFFEEVWEDPVSSGLSDGDQAWLLGHASWCLMSMGRIEEAINPRCASLKSREKLQDWKNTYTNAENLVDILILTGDLVGGKKMAEKGIIWAGLTKMPYQQMVSNTLLALSQYHLGNLEASLKLFLNAEEIQKNWQVKYPQLYSIQGAQYCALLLGMAKGKKDLEIVLKRGQYALEISKYARINKLNKSECFSW